MKSLELTGFKSFPDRTVIDFGDGMTAIVGPNGSGKSNISDAVRFVLGEVSSKSIRGDRMEDVIFGGSDRRRRMDFAEVTLTIDNTGENRVDADYDEVSVTRRYNRPKNGDPGGSEYFLNRRPARLKDIQNLFMNTGLGKGGYSLVGQGRVAEILSQKSDERRAVFEEAAGIARYRAQKEDSERRMSDVGENIDRVGDIISELESRLPQLRTDAEKAKQYLEIYERKKRAGISLALYDIDAVAVRAAECESKWTAAKQQLDIADDGIQTAEKRIDELYIKLQSLKAGAEKRLAAARELDARRQSLEGDVRVRENESSHLEEGIASLKTDIAVRREALSGLREKLKSDTAAFEEAKKALSEALEKKDGYTAVIAEKRAELSAESKSYNDLWDESEKLRSSVGRARISLSSLEADSRNSVELKEKAEKELAELTSNLGVIGGRMEKSKASIDRLKERLAEADKAASGSGDRIEALEKRRAELEDSHGRARLEAASASQKADALRRMDELFEGYNQSVRAVMQAASRGELSGICGPVSRLIRMKPRYTVAVETALGANIQNVVVEDEGAAKAAIALLKERNAGRATFYPLTTMSAGSLPAREEDLKKYKGYVGIADRLVEFDERYSGVIGYALGRTVVAEDIDCASAIARAYGFRLRIVTLDGQLINAGGSYTGGSVRRDSGMLTRARDIEKYESEAARHRIEAADIKKKIDDTAAEIASAKEEADVRRKDRELINSLLGAENTQLEVLSSQYSGDKKRADAQRDEISRLETMGAEYEKRRGDIEAGIKDGEARLSAISGDLERSQEKKDALMKAISAAERRESELAVAAASLAKDAESAQKTADLTSASISAAEDKISSGESEILERERRLLENKNRMELDKADIESMRLAAKESEEESRKNSESIAESEKRQTELSADLRRMTHDREVLYGEFARLDAQKGGFAAEKEKLTSGLWEEYELTPDTAAELGYPPVTEETRRSVAAELSECRSKLRQLGDVNVGSIDELREVQERYDFLSSQRDDLLKSRTELADIVRRLEKEMRVRFVDVFETISENFRSVFRELFGGGDASLKLTDPSEPLESGIEIEVAPPGKVIKVLSLLSGGEQAFAAIALFFAIIKVNPTPFCILDEIEAALDDVNVSRFAEYCRRYSDRTQFIAITHRRGTMEACDRLYGVTMAEKGVSTVLTLDLDEAERKIGVR